MGTRNLIMVYRNGEYKVAQYGQWDGYPSGQGLSILEYLRDKADMKKFRENVAKCCWITDQKYKEYWLEFGHDIDNSNGFVSCELSDKFNAKHPELDRSTEWEILPMIEQSENGLELDNRFEFVANSLFCEWAYVIDLDKNTLEVYEGFNTTPLPESERFSALEPYEAYDETKYYPVKLKAEFNLDLLPVDEMFLRICEPREDDEENIEDSSSF